MISRFYTFYDKSCAVHGVLALTHCSEAGGPCSASCAARLVAVLASPPLSESLCLYYNNRRLVYVNMLVFSEGDRMLNKNL